MAYVFVVALVLIFIGELADKSQLLALVFATRYKAWQVLLGIFISTLVAFSLTVLVGQWLGEAIPENVLPWVSGLLFVGFGAWTLWGKEEEESQEDRTQGRFGPVATTAVAFFLAEFGDKTQIMLLAIAANPGGALLTYLEKAGLPVAAWMGASGSADALSPVAQFVAVTLGATLGMVLADALAILVGRLLGRKLPERLLRRVSGIVFIVFGVLTIGSIFLRG